MREPMSWQLEVRALVISPNDELQYKTFNSLIGYKEAIGGSWLEVPLSCGVLLASDEFLLRNDCAADINVIATRLVQTVGLAQSDTWIFGPAIVVGLPDCDGYDTNISQKLSTLIHLIAAGVKAQDGRSAEEAGDLNAR